MCIIGICRDRKMTENEIENCFQNNSDGVGLAYPTDDGKVCVEKGFMTLESFLDAYDYINVLPHVVHFRTATSGDVSREMTHPFKMTPKSELVVSELSESPVLFHNGVIFDWKTLLVNLVSSKQIDGMPKGPMNDTRLAAIMASIGAIGDDILEVLSGKFVKVSPDGTITRWGNFDEDKVNPGVLFSNDGYKRVIYVYNGNKALGCGYPNSVQAEGKKKNKRHNKIMDMTEKDWEDYMKDVDEEQGNVEIVRCP